MNTEQERRLRDISDVEKVMAERNELLDVLRQVYATIGTSFDTTEFDAAWERAGEVLAKHTTT